MYVMVYVIHMCMCVWIRYKTKLSSAGLVYKHFGMEILTELVRKIDENAAKEEAFITVLYHKVGFGWASAFVHESLLCALKSFFFKLFIYLLLVLLLIIITATFLCI